MKAIHILLSGASGETRVKLVEEFATRLRCRPGDIELVPIPAEPGSNLFPAFETAVATIGKLLTEKQKAQLKEMAGTKKFERKDEIN